MGIRIVVAGLILNGLVAGASVDRSLVSVYKEGHGDFKVEQIIGGDIDDEEHYLYQPTDLALDSRGNLFVLDYKGYCIKKFDPEGNLLAKFGRKGQGPGEMVQALRMEIDPEDNVVLYDMAQRRFSFFENDGTFVRSVHLDEIGFGIIAEFRIHPNGDIFAEFREADFRRPQSPALVYVSKLRLEPYEETAFDSISTRDMVALQRGKGKSMQAFMFSAPFPPRLFWGILPDGNIVVACSDSYVIRTYSQDLKLIDERTIDRERSTVTKDDKEEYFKKFEDHPELPWLRRATKFPKYKPHFTNFLIDDDGFMLLRADEDGDDRGIFDVLRPDGADIGRVTLPNLNRTAIVTGGFIYRITLHEERDYAVYRYALAR